MPIVFAPPEPVRGDISSGYGAAQQWSQDFPALQRGQSDVAHAYLQSAQLQQHAQAQTQALQQQSLQHAQALDQRSYEADLHYGLGREQMANQRAMQQDAASLQDQLAQNQLSRGEQLRLQRLQEARGLIQDQVTSNALTPEEGRDALMQIQAGISPLQLRQQRSQLQMQQLLQQMAERQIANYDRLENERDQYRSASAQEHVETVTDPDSGVRYTFHRDENGRRTFMGARGNNAAVLEPGQAFTGSGGSGSGDTRSRTGDGQEREGGFDPHLHTAALHEAQALAGRDEQGHQKAPTEADIQRIYDRMANMGQPREPAVDRGQLRQQVFREMAPAYRRLLPQGGLSDDQLHAAVDAETDRRLEQARASTPQARERALAEARRAEAERQVGNVTVTVDGQDGRPQMVARVAERLRREGWQPPAQPQPQGNRPGLQPEVAPQAATIRQGLAVPGAWPRTRSGEIDREALNPAQQVLVQRFDTARERARALPQDRREHLLGVIGRAERLAARYGENMPEDARRSYEHMIEVIRRIPQRQEPAAGRQGGGLLQRAADAVIPFFTEAPAPQVRTPDRQDVRELERSLFPREGS